MSAPEKAVLDQYIAHLNRQQEARAHRQAVAACQAARKQKFAEASC